MLCPLFLGRFIIYRVLLSAFVCLLGVTASFGKACVWRVSDASGHMLYLAGSVHALRAVDYPLPSEYADAFAASAGLSFETDLSASGDRMSTALTRAATFPDGVTLKDRLDPRTYAYIERVVLKFYGSTESMKRLEHLKPWYIAMKLDSSTGSLPGLSRGYGVETFLLSRARKAHKQLDGLVPLEEHVAVLGDMSDADSEAQLLIDFIRLDKQNSGYTRTVAAWKHGDVAGVERTIAEEYGDAPGLRRRMLSDRNRRWIPKIESYLRSGKTWMVVAGAGHMVGKEGVPTLLQARGWQVEQL